MKYEILKNPENITYEKMRALSNSCFPDEPFSRNIFVEMLNQHYWIVLDEKIIIGYAHVIINEGNVHLSKIAVLKKYRGNRLGCNLLNVVVEFGKKNGASKITLSVKSENNPAISLYRKHQFEKSGEKYQLIVEIRELLSRNNSNKIEAVDVSNTQNLNKHKYNLQFRMPSGEVIGKSILDISFPGCSNYSLNNPEKNLEGSLVSLSRYLDPDNDQLFIILNDQKLLNSFLDQGHILNYSLMKMEKKLI